MVDHRWLALEAARPAVVQAFADDGVRRVECVAAFPEQADFAVWLGTVGDREADELRRAPGLRHRVTAVLKEVGFSDVDLAGLGVAVLSQETVDREYGGSWFLALR